jgi:hypothetical protein
MLNWKMAPQHPDELRLGEQRQTENGTDAVLLDVQIRGE